MALVLAAFVSDVCATIAVRSLAHRLGVVAQPGAIVPQHTRPVATSGGVAVAAAWVGTAVAAAAVLATDVDRRLVVGALLFLAIGVLDDVRPFGVAEKLAFQVVAAAIVVGLGLTLPITGFGLGDGLLALVWIIAVVNAVNVTDVCDGLVTGLAVVALFWIGALDADVRLFSLIGVGACLGFLVFNRPPASIFLGDAGAHILGFLVAGLTLVAAHDVPSWRERAAIPFVIAVPLFELALLVVVRGRRGVPWWHASPDHFSLRLQAAGVSRWHTIALAWGIAVILALLAWSTTVAMPWGG